MSSLVGCAVVCVEAFVVEVLMFLEVFLAACVKVFAAEGYMSMVYVSMGLHELTPRGVDLKRPAYHFLT